MPDFGTSSVGVTHAVTTNALLALRKELEKAGVDPAKLLLRVNMVVAGMAHPQRTDPDLVADLTVSMLQRCVPAETGGVLLLSGGQPLERACSNLRAISALAAERAVPWRLTFGFSRPLISAAAESFDSQSDNPEVSQQQLVSSARLASEALASSLVPTGNAV